jgi:hypothetical protein
MFSPSPCARFWSCLYRSFFNGLLILALDPRRALPEVWTASTSHKYGESKLRVSVFGCEGGEILEDWKIKIAVLWIIMEFCMVTVSIVGQDMPGFMPETSEMRLVLAVSLLIPPVMAFLSLILKDSVDRWVNIILSVVLIAMAYPFGLAEATADYFGAIATITIVEVVALALIVWYAWNSRQRT